MPTRSYLHSVCLVTLVLKNSYFKEHLPVVASKYSLSDVENNTSKLFFEVIMMVKDNKIQHKRYNVNQNYFNRFMHYMKWTSIFRGI